MYEPTICFIFTKKKIIINKVGKMVILSLSRTVGRDNTRSRQVRKKIQGYIKWKILLVELIFIATISTYEEVK